MPSRTSDYWRERVFSLFEASEVGAGRIVGAEIARRVEGMAHGAPPEEQTRYPAERTIRGDLLRDYNKLTQAERAAHGVVRWPASFESGLLPAESAPSVLGETAFALAFSNTEITIGYARWFWRLRSAAPDAPLIEIRGTAMALYAKELSRQLSTEDLRAVQGRLAFRSWEDDGDGITHGREAYERAVQGGRIPVWSGSIYFGAVTSRDTAVAVIQAATWMSRDAAETTIDHMIQRDEELDGKAR